MKVGLAYRKDHFNDAMATCSVPISRLFKIQYYHLRLNKAKHLVFSICQSHLHWVISDQIYIIGKLEYLWNKKRYHKKKNTTLLYFEKSFK